MRTPSPTLEDLFFSASFLLIFLDFLFSASKRDRRRKVRCFWRPWAAVKWEELEGAPGSLRVGKKKGWLVEEQLETEANRFLLAWLLTWSQGLKEKCPLREGKEEIQEGSEKWTQCHVHGWTYASCIPIFHFSELWSQAHLIWILTLPFNSSVSLGNLLNLLKIQFSYL